MAEAAAEAEAQQAAMAEDRLVSCRFERREAEASARDQVLVALASLLVEAVGPACDWRPARVAQAFDL